MHVPTDENPTDLCSRGICWSKLAKSRLWWNGAEWLNKEKSEWLKMQPVDHPKVMPEMKTVKTTGKRNYSLCNITNHQPRDIAILCWVANSADWRLDPKHFCGYARMRRSHHAGIMVKGTFCAKKETF